MAVTFRYRIRRFRNSLYWRPGNSRRGNNDSNSPGLLYVNELASWTKAAAAGTRNEPLSIIDHHFTRDNQFPSASAAVLHKARSIREKFSTLDSQKVPWWSRTSSLTSATDLRSLQLARRTFVEDPDAPIDWASCGLHPDGLRSTPPAITRSTGSTPTSTRRLRRTAGRCCLPRLRLNRRQRPAARPLPGQRALHSALDAALKRGRDYLNDTSGACEFFDQVRRLRSGRSS